MQGTEGEGKTVGLVLDLSIRHAEGRRIIDIVKKQLIQVIRELFEYDVDGFYLYHPDITTASYQHGSQCCSIANYETDEWKFDLDFALKQTLYVTCANPFDQNKFLILITDRLTNDKGIKKILRLNDNCRFDCKLVVIGIGAHYNREIDFLDHIHLDQPSDLFSTLKDKVF